jgi:hypothetical protein
MPFSQVQYAQRQAEKLGSPTDCVLGLVIKDPTTEKRGQSNTHG